MATTRATAEGHAHALRPARVNIFTRPASSHDETDAALRRPQGVFNDTAACPSTPELADRLVAASAHASARLSRAASLRRPAYVIALAAAATALMVAVSTHSRSQSVVTAPMAPPVRHWRQPDASHVTELWPSPPHAGHHRTERRHDEGHRAARSTSNTTSPSHPLVRALPPSARHVVPPRRDPPAHQPAPKRVAPDAPPEFM